MQISESNAAAPALHIIESERVRTSAGSDSRILHAAYFLLLLVVCGLAFSHASVNWDVLPYTANVEAQHTRDFFAVHRAAYQEVQRHFSEHDFHVLVSDTPNDVKSYADPVFFVRQLPFFSIRPLYIILLRAADAVGISPVIAARLIGSFALFVIGAIAYLWMQRYAGAWPSFSVALLLLFCYPVLLLGRLHTPDGIAAATALTAFFLLLERKQMFWGILLLMLSVYIRTDNSILALLAVAYLWSRHELRWTHAVTLAALAIASVSLINTVSGNYGYAALFQNSFRDPLGDPVTQSHAGVTPAQYAEAFRAGFVQLQKSYAPEFLLLGVIAIGMRSSPLRNLALLALAYGAVHFVAYPDFEDRFFGFAYVAFVIAAAATAAKTKLPRLVQAQSAT